MNFMNGNADNITEAIHGLDIFTKNWCMDCYMTKQTGEPTFNCRECEFEQEDGKCSIKIFAQNHKHDYPLSEFGSMGMH